MNGRPWSVAAFAAGFIASGVLRAVAAEPPVVRNHPLREAYYGDLHLHTSYSLDAYLGGASQVDPDTAYKFAKGEVVNYLGQPMRRREPLDFLAVTDHAENLGVVNELDDPGSLVSQSDVGKALRTIVDAMTGSDGRMDVERLVDKPRELNELYARSQDYAWGRRNKLPDDLKPVSGAAWTRAIELANRNYAPGRFTTFIAYEWTAAAHGANLHRNVIFRGGSAPSPFTSWDSRNPEDLWDWLDAIRMQGFEALAIPHNSNASNGLMYDWLDSSAGYIDRGYAEERQANEPLSEISQNKGASETHPLLSPNDEFADYEIYDYMAEDRRGAGPAQGSYLRDALGRGLVLQLEVGVNPFKYGFAGASDLHSGLSVSAQADYSGSYYRPNIAAGRPTRAEAASVLVEGSQRVEQTRATTTGSLTGVWAESNTRESLYDALRRRETFATSGTRLKFRFFGGWEFTDALLRDGDWVRTAYRQGVPMGGDLPAAPAAPRAPAFAIWAVKDPSGGNLDRVQVVKVWAEGRLHKERVLDVAWAGERTPDPKTGRLPALGDTVDLKTGTYTNAIGAVELKAVWRDPDFDRHRYAAYYIRVLEIPTPRWTTLLAVEAGLPLPKDVPSTIQQRGWSSPIWYTPPSGGH
jgi:uncharacterized protein DUF3604